MSGENGDISYIVLTQPVLHVYCALIHSGYRRGRWWGTWSWPSERTKLIIVLWTTHWAAWRRTNTTLTSLASRHLFVSPNYLRPPNYMSSKSQQLPGLGTYPEPLGLYPNL